jgi:hypothetical protein
VDLLEAALIEPQRSRMLFKACSLIATRRIAMAAATALASEGVPAVLRQDITAMAGPPYLSVGRVAQAQELPRVSIQPNDDDDAEEEGGQKEAFACVWLDRNEDVDVCAWMDRREDQIDGRSNEPKRGQTPTQFTTRSVVV